jgi:predicted acetyltransferase
VNIAIQSDNKIVSALQMIPYPMSFCGTSIQTSYISGACTHPDYRKRGIMRELLSKAFARMYSDGVFISTLIPEEPHLVDYYTRMGYASVFNYSKRIFSLAEIPPTNKNLPIIEHTTEYREDIYNYLNQKISGRSCCIQHTEADFKVVLADLFLSKGGVFYAIGPGKAIEGIAIAIAGGDTLYFSELVAESQEIENELLRQAAIMCGCTRLHITIPPIEALKPFPFGMARIIDAKGVLNLYAVLHPEVEMDIELHDSFLSPNNGHYYLCNGKCTVSKDKSQRTPLRLTINELTEKILGEMQPYMSLMIN